MANRVCVGAERPRHGEHMSILSYRGPDSIQSTIVYEDEQALAFQDIHPQAPVHLLVIPSATFSRFKT